MCYLVFGFSSAIYFIVFIVLIFYHIQVFKKNHCYIWMKIFQQISMSAHHFV